MSDFIVVDEKLIDKLDEAKIDNGKCIMLYAKILAMSGNKGYTTAGNAYFGRILNLEDRQVRRHLNSLEEAGCITRFEKRRGSHTEARMIYPKLFIKEEDDVGQECPEWTDETSDPGHKCPRPRTRMTKTPDGYDQNPGHPCPPVKESNRYIKDNSTADAETDASLIDVPLRCTEDVASAPNSTNVARLRLPDDLPEEIRNIKFEAMVPDFSMLSIMNTACCEYLEGKNDNWETYEDIRNNIIKEFTGGFYCANKESVTAYADFLMKHYEQVLLGK